MNVNRIPPIGKKIEDFPTMRDTEKLIAERREGSECDCRLCLQIHHKLPEGTNLVENPIGGDK